MLCPRAHTNLGDGAYYDLFEFRPFILYTAIQARRCSDPNVVPKSTYEVGHGANTVSIFLSTVSIILLIILRSFEFRPFEYTNLQCSIFLPRFRFILSKYTITLRGNTRFFSSITISMNLRIHPSSTQ
jgi:hypothetical protein